LSFFSQLLRLWAFNSAVLLTQTHSMATYYFEMKSGFSLLEKLPIISIPKCI
jgi:hypothetical protein